MVKVKVKAENLSKFLNAWDKDIFDLNVELRKINLKQRKEQLVIQKKEGIRFRLQKQLILFNPDYLSFYSL